MPARPRLLAVLRQGWSWTAGLAIAFWGCFASAQPPGIPRDFVWRISGTPATVYLAGSLHELRARDRPSLSLYQAYALADRVVFEADLAEFATPAFEERVHSLSTQPPGRGLTNDVDTVTYELLSRIARRNELPEDLFNRFQPWFAGTYAALLLLSEAGFQEDHGIDRYFYDRCVREGKRLEFLESGAEQLELLATIPASEAIESLRQDLEAGVDHARALVEAWSQGDAETLDRLSRVSSDRAPQSFQRFMVDRNLAWLPRLKTWLKDTNTTLVIVGAGHLVGTNGVVRLLERDGYSVTQLP